MNIADVEFMKFCRKVTIRLQISFEFDQKKHYSDQIESVCEIVRTLEFSIARYTVHHIIKM